jgi:hypothetical protein
MMEKENGNAPQGELLDPERPAPEMSQGKSIALTGDFGGAKTPAEFIQNAKDRIEMLNAFETLSLSRTSEADWLIMGNGDDAKPYLSEAGCRRIMPLWGIGVESDSVTFEIEPDPENPAKKTVLCSGVMYCKTTNARERIAGTKACDDAFLRSKGGYDDIRKAAYANLIQRGTKSFLGLGNVTWAKLQAAGIEQAKCKRVEYQTGKPEAKDIDADLKVHVRECILLLTNGNRAEAAKKLKEYTTFSYTDKKTGQQKDVAGVEKVDDIRSQKQLEIVQHKIHDDLRAAGIAAPEMPKKEGAE